jgi:hypothetical protein
MRLGIDIGRVIISPDPEGTRGDTSFIGGSIQDALNTPPFEGMFDVVPALVELFHGQVWLVSKARPRVQEKTRLWLAHHRFFERTGIPAENLRFCIERPQKADHCRELGITHFIDDRCDVLDCLEGIVPHRFLFGPQKNGISCPGLTPLPDWNLAMAKIKPTLG